MIAFKIPNNYQVIATNLQVRVRPKIFLWNPSSIWCSNIFAEMQNSNSIRRRRNAIYINRVFMWKLKLHPALRLRHAAIVFSRHRENLCTIWLRFVSPPSRLSVEYYEMQIGNLLFAIWAVQLKIRRLHAQLKKKSAT